jgi:hypothetical protein
MDEKEPSTEPHDDHERALMTDTMNLSSEPANNEEDIDGVPILNPSVENEEDIDGIPI